MAEAEFLVRHAGPHVTVQDGGRPGLMRFGVPASGAMDRPALALANAALGNPPDAAAIEVSLGGLQIELVRGAITLAVAGGGFILDRAGRRGGSWSVFTLVAGERLAIRPGPWGSWCYLAFAGRLRAPAWLGAQTTHAASGLGGGRLAPGGQILVAGGEPRPEREGAIPCPVWARPAAELALVLGPQERHFPPEAIEALTHSPFRLTPAQDRMGYRLDGPRLTPQAALALPSEPLLRGAVQVAGDGVATVLMADHQTTGGYPKIATLVGCETDRLAQLRPNQPLWFRPVSPEQALALHCQRAGRLAICLAALAEGRAGDRPRPKAILPGQGPTSPGRHPG